MAAATGRRRLTRSHESLLDRRDRRVVVYGEYLLSVDAILDLLRTRRMPATSSEPSSLACPVTVWWCCDRSSPGVPQHALAPQRE
ncbi:hypothetical protein ACFS2C_10020 [Prauserella oleivorans]|uniref:Uncharacterized protein n=1 Tax=Prauserella oleivorans TaxID=1478153 RepID=A0ABW5W7F1_9PSEU